eukprot:1147947-Pelagomonas_calceolata.AAC.2
MACSPNIDENRRTPDHSPGLRSLKNGPQLHPRTKFLRLSPPYTLLLSCISNNRKEGSQNLTFLAPLVLDFLEGKWLKFCISPTAGSFHSILFAMISFWYNNFESLKITQYGAVGGQEWRLGGQKVGFTLWLIWRVRPNPEQ